MPVQHLKPDSPPLPSPIQPPLWESKAENPRSNKVNTRNGEKNMTLDVLHYNCRSLASEVRMNEIEEALKEIKWDIVGLSEIRRDGERIYKRKNGNYFYFFGETVGCLLYTSPSPRDRTRSRMPSSA